MLYGVGTADGAKLPGGVSVPVVVVVFAVDVVFVGGFTVTGIPHILDSVVLTGLSFDNGLLGLHIASICSGVYVTFPIVTFPCLGVYVTFPIVTFPCVRFP